MLQENQTGKILIIDDEAVIRNMLKAILEDNYSILCADNSFEGLNIAREESPDLILLDINMPVFDGYELCRLLKDDPDTKQIPIIFLTALTTPEDETRGLEAGAADYISKPINPNIVCARVKNQVEVKLQRDYLEKLSTIDPLTGVANRRCFDDTLKREWRRCQRDKKPLSLLAIDIDCFKLYNDHFGHLIGDKCLIQVANLLDNALNRGGDLFARIGGEEFIALLPDTPLESLGIVAERLRSAIEDAEIPHKSSSVAKVVTISVGGATMIPDKELEPVDLYAQADKRLYAAKQKGRNQFCIQAEEKA